MSTGTIRAIWISMMVICVLYANTAQAQSLFPTVYPKIYTVDCSGKTCGAATCTSTGPFVDLGTTGEMQFNSATAGVGSQQTSVADGAQNVTFGTTAFTFTAVNGSAATTPPATCTSPATAACVPRGCAFLTDTLGVLKTTSHAVLCFSHNGAEFSMVGTDTLKGTYVCHGAAQTQ